MSNSDSSCLKDAMDTTSFDITEHCSRNKMNRTVLKKLNRNINYDTKKKEKNIDLEKRNFFFKKRTKNKTTDNSENEYRKGSNEKPDDQFTSTTLLHSGSITSEKVDTLDYYDEFIVDEDALDALENVTAESDVDRNLIKHKCGPEPQVTHAAQINGNSAIEKLDVSFEDWFEEGLLDLSTMQKCKVLNVDKQPRCIVLQLESIENILQATVKCTGLWQNEIVQENDIVSVEAFKENEQWIIDNNNGLLVVQPDTLIASTTIASSIFCKRRAVLAEKFRKVEALPTATGTAVPMLVGQFIHQVFQSMTEESGPIETRLQKICEQLKSSDQIIYDLYACEITLDEFEQKIDPYMDNIKAFFRYYVEGQESIDSMTKTTNYKGKISNIRDIEENFWVPKLGLKGKIDLTVQMEDTFGEQTMPLELKTGKPAISLEHRAQVILYVLMMNSTNIPASKGLLSYLSANIVQELKGTHAEKRDLIMLRNSLAYYFSNYCKDIEDTIPDIEKQRNLNLPELISHPACRQCPYKELCCAFLTKSESIKWREQHPLAEFIKEYAEKVNVHHINYVLNWISLLEMEQKAQDNDTLNSKLWTMCPKEREANGSCISNMIVAESMGQRNAKYIYKFVRAHKSSETSTRESFRKFFVQNEYVILSTKVRVNILSGYISDVNDSYVDISLGKKIPVYLYFDTFHIDKFSSSGLTLTSIANVAGLLSHDPIAQRLREIVIDRKPATFASKLPKHLPPTFEGIIEQLNENQRAAIQKVLRAKDYVLIKGMPGTGKTQTLVALIKILYACNSSVLITAHTHSAVDNILRKLLREGIDFLRLGAVNSIDPSLRHKSERETFANIKSTEELNAIYESKKIVGVTCFGAVHTFLRRRIFDYCIVDESAQAMQPVVLRPLYNARIIVLAGDPDQLPPIILSKSARRLGADESLFKRLDNKNNTMLLVKQYRMNKCIMQFANKLTYHDKLEMGSDDIQYSTFSAPRIEMLTTKERWIQKALSQNLDESVIVLNTGPTRTLSVPAVLRNKYPESDQIYANLWEGGIILHLIESLLLIGTDPNEIGIISPYKSHALFLKKIVNASIEINTVDQYQGRDKHVIIYTCARSDPANTEKDTAQHLLADHRRLTVAVTRAKHKFILIGNKDMLLCYEPFKIFFKLIANKHLHNLANGCDGFGWEKIISIIS